MYAYETSNKSNIACGVMLIVVPLGLGAVLLVIGLAEDIQDLLILGGIFLGFSVIFCICVCGFIFRPIYNARKVCQSETQASVEKVGFSGSQDDLDRIANSFVKIKVGTDDVHSMQAERDADNITVHVKSRIGSAASNNSYYTETSPSGKKKKVSFY